MSQHLTFASYGDFKVDLYAYFPEKVTGKLPVVVYFHGGYLITGSATKTDAVYPHWIEEGTLERGMIFISANYRLLNPFTAHDQLEDVKALFKYIPTIQCPDSVTIDTSKIAVVGISGGGYIGRLAALHASPSIAAYVSLFGMGGEMFSDRWVKPFPEALPVEDKKFEPAADLPIHLGPTGADDKQGRGDWLRTVIRGGVFNDYFTGAHGISEKMRSSEVGARSALVSEKDRILYPELHMATYKTPTLFVHGDQDSGVLVSESTITHEILKAKGVQTEIVILEGAEHGLYKPGTREQMPGAEEAYQSTFTFVEKVFSNL